jgi:hypothetical protein
MLTCEVARSALQTVNLMSAYGTRNEEFVTSPVDLWAPYLFSMSHGADDNHLGNCCVHLKNVYHVTLLF